MQVIDLALWEKFKKQLFIFNEYYFVPSFRRFLRFIALPYCYFYLVNWKECKAGKIKVIYDFCYIFFILKYFPDNYSLCRLWEKKKSEWVFYYGSNYDPYQRRNLRKNVQRKEYEVIFENKYICYQMCKAEGLPLPIQYPYIKSRDTFRSLVTLIFKADPDKKLIVKPVDGRAGKGIMLLWQKNGNILVKGGADTYDFNSMPFAGPYVMQDYVLQHPMMAKMSPSSVNTIRIVTFLTDDNEVIFVGASARFGLGDNFVDNKSRGGVGVGLDIEKGRLVEYGYDFSSQRHSHHPTSGIVFRDFQVPLWEELLSVAERTQKSFQYFRLLGQDIALSTIGPVIIELNSIYDNVGLEQCYGPILKNKKLLKEYGKNSLLINRQQKRLFAAL